MSIVPSPSTPLRRCLLGLVLVASATTAGAQVARQRYVKSRVLDPLEHARLVQAVAAVAVDQDPQTGVVQDIFFPQFGFSAVGSVLRPDQAQALDSARYEIREDVPLTPAGTPTGPSWPLNQFCLEPAPPQSAMSEPVVYLIDSGITPGHNDFQYPAGPPVLTFLPGLSYAYDLSGPTPVPLPPYVDPHDHGTRVAGCLGGLTSGLLGALGGRARVKSVVIYDAPAPLGLPLATYVSKAINGILGAAADHLARRADPYLHHRASVLVFAHTTTPAAGRFADLDRAVEIAEEAGMHVVLSAGNSAAPAVGVSPAGAAWGYFLGSVPTRFFFGAPPPGASFYRAADEFLVTGAFTQVDAGALKLWPATNFSIPGAAAVDLNAPGDAVSCPSSAGPAVYALGSGTSCAAGFAAAVAASTAGHCPWASPTQLRTTLVDAASTASGFHKLESPTVFPDGLSYRDWIDAYHPPAVSLPADRDPTNDPDNDGLINLLEYYCGLDPRFPDALAPPHVDLARIGVSVAIEIGLHRADYLPAAPHVRWDLEGSTDLVTWSPVATVEFSEATPTDRLGDGRRWRAKSADPPPPAGCCYRLRFVATAPLL